MRTAVPPTVELEGGVRAAWSDRTAGDLRPAGFQPEEGAPLAAMAERLCRSTGTPVHVVAWVTQVHGAEVHVVRGRQLEHPPPKGTPPGAEHVGIGDALVADAPGTSLCVLTADCGPLALSSREGLFAVVHVGWRGLLAGIVEAAVARMRRSGATGIVGAMGPCIHPECYEFAGRELDSLAKVYGDGVRGRTSTGSSALDLPAGIGVAMERAGATLIAGVDRCTACDDRYFSHRARCDTGRQALVVWSSGP